MLLVIADDLTGANDAGVQFAKRGIRSVVLVEANVTELPPGYEVVVVNTESRHIPATEAAERVRRIACLGQEAGVSHFFKKTDSTLRGNIGAELNALLQATGEETIAFAPAFPEMGRTTRAGIHHVNGVPIEQTVFADDPLSPVRESEVVAVVRRGVDWKVASVSRQDFAKRLGAACVVFDCESRDDLRRIASILSEQKRLRVLAGSAAFAEELPDLLALRRTSSPAIRPRGPILFVNGSLNPRALEQVAAAPSNFVRVRMSPEVLLQEGGVEAFVQTTAGAGENILLHSLQHREEYAAFRGAAATVKLDESALHLRIANSTGQIVKGLLEQGNFRTVIIFGGDTLIGVARANGWTAFVPRAEIEAGVTVAHPLGSELTVISKAGGFGDAEVVSRIARWISGKD